MKTLYIIGILVFLTFSIVNLLLRNYEAMKFTTILMTLYQILVSLEDKK